MSSTRRSVALIALGIGLFGGAMALRHVADPWWTNVAVALFILIACVAGAGPALRARLAVAPRSVLTAVALGAVVVVGTHTSFRLATGLIPGLADSVSVLYGTIASARLPLALTVPLTALVVAAEETLFRGVAFDLCQRRLSPGRAAALSLALYVAPQVIGGSPILVAAAILLGALFTWQRLVSGSLTPPLITHAIWSISVFNLLPVLEVRP